MKRLLPAALALLVAGCCLLTQTAEGGYRGSITNNGDTAAVAPFFQCAPAYSATTDANTFFEYKLADAAGSTTAADSSSNNTPGTYTSAGVTFGVPGPCTRDTSSLAITLDGSSGYLVGPSATTQANPQTFTEEIWFKTTTVKGGKLIGFGNAKTGASSAYDRQIYMTNAGLLEFGIYNGSAKTVVTTKAYNDGKWHYAAGTLSAGTGITLYVDGAKAASNATYNVAETNTGYWRIGYDALSTSWPSAPTSAYFAGSLAWADVYTVVLTPAQIASHYGPGS